MIKQGDKILIDVDKLIMMLIYSGNIDRVTCLGLKNIISESQVKERNLDVTKISAERFEHFQTLAYTLRTIAGVTGLCRTEKESILEAADFISTIIGDN